MSPRDIPPDDPPERPPERSPEQGRARAVRKQVPLRLDPAVHDALARWAEQDLRSLNAQIEMLLRRALADAGRLPRDVGEPARRGRPRGPVGQGGSGSATGSGGAGASA